MLGWRVRRLTTDALTATLTIGACVSVALLFWFGYRAVEEWRLKSFCSPIDNPVTPPIYW
jgi:hypothetical protein